MPLGKRDPVRIDGEPHNPFGLLSAAGAVNARDELAQRQKFLPVIGFHRRKYRPGARAPAIRCFPHARLDESGARTTAR